MAEVPSSIDSTGETDATAPLLAFFASVPDGSVISFPTGAAYRCEGTLLLANRGNLTFEGNGASIFARTIGSEVAPPSDTYRPGWPRKREHLAFVGGGGITLRNLHVKGAHPNGGTSPGAYVEPLEAQHGISAMSVDGIELDNVTITDVYGDFLYLGGQRGEWSMNVHVHDSRFERNGRQGIGITGAENVLIERNYIGHVRRTAIDIEPGGNLGGTRHLTLRNNTFGPIRLTFLAGHGVRGFADHVTVEGNRLTASAMKILTDKTAVNRHLNWRIEGNTSDVTYGSPAPLMRLHCMDGLVARGNVQRMNPRREGTGILVTQSTGVVVGGNQFPGSLKEYEVRP